VKRFPINRLSLIAAMMLLATAVAAQDSISVSISLNRDVISMNEQAILTLTVTAMGQRDLPQPQLPPLPLFEVNSVGSSTNFAMVNGAVTYSRTYSFALAPKQEGIYPIRSAWVVVNGRRYESNQLSIRIVKSSSSVATPTPTPTQSSDNSGTSAADMFLTAEIDKRNPYVDEQVVLKIKFFRGIQLMGSPDYTPPSTSGFWTSDIAPQKQYYQTVNGRNYLVTEIPTALFPTQPGTLTIGEAQISAVVPERTQKRSQDPFSVFDDFFQQGRRVTVKSRPVTIGVKPLPSNGKPDQFTGCVGDYKITADVDKTEVEANEAVTLDIKVSGQGNVRSIPEPTLPKLDGFRVEKSTSDFKLAPMGNDLGGTKTFEYVLIPRLPGRQTIGPISLSYFDPARRKYQTISTVPIELSIRPGQLATGAEIPYNMVSGQSIDLKQNDIRFIKTGKTHLIPKGRILLTSPLFLILAVIPLIALAAGIVDVRRRNRLSGDIRYARLRRAKAVARKRLRKAEKLLLGDDHIAFYAEVSAMILDYVADKFNLSPHGLTTDRVDELLREKNVEETLRNDTLAVLKEADFGRFAGAAQEADMRQNLFEKARAVIIELEEAV